MDEFKPEEKTEWTAQVPPAGVQTNPPPPPIDLGDVTVAGTPPAVESPAEQPVEFRGLLVRAGGDNIFLLKQGKKHWVTNPEAMEKLGFKFGDEVEIDRATLAIIPEGEPLK
jgi:hypothetical protein